MDDKTEPKTYWNKWYEKNGEKIRAKRKTEDYKYRCECGSFIRIDNINRHYRTVKHQSFTN